MKDERRKKKKDLYLIKTKVVRLIIKEFNVNFFL